MQLKFTKMHALGNDFLFIDKSITRYLDPSSIVLIANRKLGIGCDQVIFYERNFAANYQVQIYNPDGSQAGMCGNAMRCLGLLCRQIYDEGQIAALVGNKRIKIDALDADNIKVNMGPAELNSEWMPKLPDLINVLGDWQIDLKEVMCADIGNRHLVIFYRNLGDQDKILLGQSLQNMHLFEDGINVNFARITSPNSIHLRVFERGAGMTLACGSGACATFAVARKLKFVEERATINFEMGELFMSSLNDEIIMSGPATKVAEVIFNEAIL